MSIAHIFDITHPVQIMVSESLEMFVVLRIAAAYYCSSQDISRGFKVPRNSSVMRNKLFYMPCGPTVTTQAVRVEVKDSPGDWRRILCPAVSLARMWLIGLESCDIQKKSRVKYSVLSHVFSLRHCSVKGIPDLAQRFKKSRGWLRYVEMLQPTELLSRIP